MGSKSLLLITISLGIAVSGCSEEKPGDPPKGKGEAASETGQEGKHILSVETGTFASRMDAYIVNLEISFQCNPGKPLEFTVHGKTRDGEEGFLPIEVTNSPVIQVIQKNDISRFTVKPSDKNEVFRETVSLLLPYRWTFSGGADMTVTVQARNQKDKVIDERQIDFRVPPPPPVFPR